jgi:hypothetical protein
LLIASKDEETRQQTPEVFGHKIGIKQIWEESLYIQLECCLYSGQLIQYSVSFSLSQ